MCLADRQNNLVTIYGLKDAEAGEEAGERMVRRLLPKGRRQVICSLWNINLPVGTSMKLQHTKQNHFRVPSLQHIGGP